MAKVKTIFFCQECGMESPKWLGKCPACNQWNSFVEQLASPRGNKLAGHRQSPVQPVTEVNLEDEERFGTGIVELDRVLGGGVVPGSVILVGGDPGIGKSTLLLQAAWEISSASGQVLYVSGEESARQIAMRAKRLGVMHKNLLLFTETAMEAIEAQIVGYQPRLVIIDSIQTIFKSDLPMTPGSLGQVRECTGHLMRLAKEQNISIVLVGHVTKEGSLAGPRILEHIVDVVLYLEGERHHAFRILRSAKNRFGSTNEIGIFEMGGQGLQAVVNPSEVLLAERSEDAAGSVVVAILEGTRPVLLEVQALVSSTVFGNPRRLTTGLDHNRVAMLLAVLEKRAGLHVNNFDAFVNVAGGVRIQETGADMGIALAIASSLKNKPVVPKTMVVGEIGLTGEVRRVAQIQRRLLEAEKLGFNKAIIPYSNYREYVEEKKIDVIGVRNISEAMEAVLGGG
ncbi:MAG: DNA repair protein RadA [Clostridia bacterium]|nr:DNA repair protein RadA [Clostridia bacterium]